MRLGDTRIDLQYLDLIGCGMPVELGVERGVIIADVLQKSTRGLDHAILHPPRHVRRILVARETGAVLSRTDGIDDAIDYDLASIA